MNVILVKVRTILAVAVYETSKDDVILHNPNFFVRLIFYTQT